MTKYFGVFLIGFMLTGLMSASGATFWQGVIVGTAGGWAWIVMWEHIEARP